MTSETLFYVLRATQRQREIEMKREKGEKEERIFILAAK